MRTVDILDTTLRDGAQGEGISFSLQDKLDIVRALDRLGVSYIEGGNPAASAGEAEFFRRAGALALARARLAAFGSTRRRDAAADTDPGLAALLAAETPVVVLFGKAWPLHVTEVLGVSPDDNLRMIEESVAHVRAAGREVIFDAEHFFDGVREAPDYAMACLRAASRGGAAGLVLCDTNGGAFPDEITRATEQVCRAFSLPVGIHCHNDGGMAVANSVAAVLAGASHVQGTLLGFGERCGNAELCAVIGNLQLKRGFCCLLDEQLRELTAAARTVSEICNLPLSHAAPYVGGAAFAHKAGMHADAVAKNSRSFEHIDPETVGNERRFLLSELSGRTAVFLKISKLFPHVTRESEETRALLETLKALEHQGYQFDGAEGSFELVVRRALGRWRPFFELLHFKTISEGGELPASALVKIAVDGREEMAAAEGNGPVNALDRALRRALETFYPALRDMRLLDYKVRVLGGGASAARVRVLITSTDGKREWGTVGVSSDLIEASRQALCDSIEYKLGLDGQ